MIDEAKPEQPSKAQPAAAAEKPRAPWRSVQAPRRVLGPSENHTAIVERGRKGVKEGPDAYEQRVIEGRDFDTVSQQFERLTKPPKEKA